MTSGLYVKGSNALFLERASAYSLPFAIDDPPKQTSHNTSLDVSDLIIDLMEEKRQTFVKELLSQSFVPPTSILKVINGMEITMYDCTHQFSNLLLKCFVTNLKHLKCIVIIIILLSSVVTRATAYYR